MDTLAALLAACFADPLEATPRACLADYCDENDVTRIEFPAIVPSVALSKAEGIRLAMSDMVRELTRFSPHVPWDQVTGIPKAIYGTRVVIDPASDRNTFQLPPATAYGLPEYIGWFKSCRDVWQSYWPAVELVPAAFKSVTPSSAAAPAVGR